MKGERREYRKQEGLKRDRKRFERELKLTLFLGARCVHIYIHTYKVRRMADEKKSIYT